MSWYTINRAADMRASAQSGAAEVFIYGDIGDMGWGESVSATEFAREFAAIDDPEITVYINSPGGSVFDGLAILNAIRRHPSRVSVVVDGLAASAASFIALGGDTLTMGRNSMMMIHDAAGGAWGNAADMAQQSAVLDQVSDVIAAIYAEKAGGTPESWREQMRAETWLNAEQAVEVGLADSVDDSRLKRPDDAPTEQPSNVVAITGGERRSGRPSMPLVASAVAAARVAASMSPEASASDQPTHVPPAQPGTTYRKDDSMTVNFEAGVRERLGIPADSELNEDGILAALDEALSERATTNHVEVPEGVTMIDQATLDELRAAASQVAQIKAEADAKRREGIVAQAITEGRIPPARREHWLNLLNADEDGGTQVLNGLEKGTVPLAAIGVTGGVEASNDDDKLYAMAWGNTNTKEA